MVLYFRKTIGGVKRPSYARAQATSIMTMLRAEYRTYTTANQNDAESWYRTIFPRDRSRKMRAFVQGRALWADLVKHITTSRRYEPTALGNGQQAVPWSNTPIIRIQAADARVPE